MFCFVLFFTVIGLSCAAAVTISVLILLFIAHRCGWIQIKKVSLNLKEGNVAFDLMSLNTKATTVLSLPTTAATDLSSPNSTIDTIVEIHDTQSTIVDNSKDDITELNEEPISSRTRNKTA